MSRNNVRSYKKMINEAVNTYPNFKAVATTLREVKTATVNDWSAICWCDGEVYKAKDYTALEIMEHIISLEDNNNYIHNVRIFNDMRY